MASDQKTNGQADGVKGSSGLSQVREILMGPRFREYDRRMARLAKRMTKEIESLRTEIVQQGEELEEYLRSEVAALQDQIKQLGSGHGSSIKDLQRDTKALASSAEKNVSRLEERLSRSAETLKAHATQQSDRVRTTMQKRCDEIQDTVGALEEFVEGAEVERQSMGKLFQQLVQTLSAGPKSKKK